MFSAVLSRQEVVQQELGSILNHILHIRVSMCMCVCVFVGDLNVN